MGIKDLSSWIAKYHPEAIKHLPSRWASREVKGKRIAIDATLLTNRYHFASFDGDLKGKGALIGWFNLITLMRQHGVRAVAVWDRPGARDWKFDEKSKRWAVRALNHARSAHEDERGERLLELRSAMREMDAMDEQEQAAIRTLWARTQFLEMGAAQRKVSEGDGGPTPGQLVESETREGRPTGTAPADSEVASTRIPETLPDAPSRPPKSSDMDPDELASIERVSNMTDTLSALVARYRASQHTDSIPTFPTESAMQEAVAHLSELEDLTESLPDASAESATGAELERVRERAQEWLVSKMNEIIPPGLFSESRRQAEMTAREGEIIRAFLSPSGTSASLDATGAERPELDARPEEALEALVQSVPESKAIYERALHMPTKHTHEDCRELLGRLGVPVIFAEVPYEAEGLAASLAREGLVDYVGTEDSDAIPLGGPQMRNLSTSRKPLSVISTPELLERLGLGPAEFLDFCILLGNDAIDRIPKIGPMTAYRLVKEYGSIEGIFAANPALLARAEQMKRVAPAPIARAASTSAPTSAVASLTGTEIAGDSSEDEVETGPGKEGEKEGYMDRVRRAREVFMTLPPVGEAERDEIMRAWKEVEEDVGEVERLEDAERWLRERHGVVFVGQEEAAAAAARAEGAGVQDMERARVEEL